MNPRAADLGSLLGLLSALDPHAFGLRSIQYYPGATPWCARSTLACRFAPGHRRTVAAAFAEAARQLGARLDLEIGQGLVERDSELIAWLEYFPGGLRPASSAFALQALRCAFAAERPSSDLAAMESQRFAALGPPAIFVQSHFLIVAARKADIPVDKVALADSLWRFGWGSRADIFFGTASHGDSLSGHQITWKKSIAKTLFRELGLPTPNWRLAEGAQDAAALAEAVGWPCVVKPLDQAFGRGVTADVRDGTMLRSAMADAARFTRSIMIEAHEPGFDHRLMIVDGRLLAAVRRSPPGVTGDGQSTIAELVETLNAGRDGTRAKGYLLPVVWDQEVDSRLAAAGLSATSILPGGTRFSLRSIANFSTGGHADDVTAQVHPQIRQLAESLAASLGLRTAGIDYITPDISRSHGEVGGGFIEVNAMPRLRLLLADGQAEEAIIAALLGERPGRIPVTLLVANPGALAALTPAIEAQIASRPGAALATPGSGRIGSAQLPAPGRNAFDIASGLLRNGGVDHLFVAWTAEDIRTFGLPVDRAGRAVVLGTDIADEWLTPYARRIVPVDSEAAALDALFAIEG